MLIFFIKLFTLFIQPKSTKNTFGGELQLKKESKITYSEMGKIPDKIQIEFKSRPQLSNCISHTCIFLIPTNKMFVNRGHGNVFYPKHANKKPYGYIR